MFGYINGRLGANSLPTPGKSKNLVSYGSPSPRKAKTNWRAVALPRKNFGSGLALAVLYSCDGIDEHTPPRIKLWKDVKPVFRFIAEEAFDLRVEHCGE